MAIHGIYFPDLRPAQGCLTIGGEEAHHALRVKRVGVGDIVRLTNGKGLVADAKLVDSRKNRDGWQMDLEVPETRTAERVVPRLRVLAAAPKGDRLEAMIDGLSQVGAMGWRPLHAERTVVDPRPGKLERLERIAVEAMKQSGRAWLLEIAESIGFDDAIKSGGRVVMADASGPTYAPRAGDDVTLLVGPEGGWTDGELAAARQAGVEVARFSVHIMRTETAAVVAAGIVMSAANQA